MKYFPGSALASKKRLNQKISVRETKKILYIKSNAYKNKASCNCTKSQTFSNSCAQNHHDLLAKIVEEVNGTKCGELCCYKHWALVVV